MKEHSSKQASSSVDVEGKDDASNGPSSSSSSISAEAKRAERMKRLRELHLRRVRLMAVKEEGVAVDAFDE